MRLIIISFVVAVFGATFLLAEDQEEKDEMGAIVLCMKNDSHVYVAGNFTEEIYFDDDQSKCYYACVLEKLDELVNGTISTDTLKQRMQNASEEVQTAITTCAKCSKNTKNTCDLAYNFLVCLKNNTDNCTTNDVTC